MLKISLLDCRHKPHFHLHPLRSVPRARLIRKQCKHEKDSIINNAHYNIIKNIWIC